MIRRCTIAIIFTIASSAFAQPYKDPLITSEFLATAIANNPANLTILHFSLKNCTDYAEEHIATAFCFDGEEARDKLSPYENMLPNAVDFARYVGSTFGIGQFSHVVIYDSEETDAGLRYATRGWLMFHVFGHLTVSLLEGGLMKWKRDGNPTTKTKAQAVKPATFLPRFQRELIVSFDDIQRNLITKEFQLIDARPSGEYSGEKIAANRCRGHLAGALNLPVSALMDQETLRMYDPDQLQAIFESRGIDLGSHFVGYSTSGVQASAIAFAAYRFGRDIPIYDGSIVEWCTKNGELQLSPVIQYRRSNVCTNLGPNRHRLTKLYCSLLAVFFNQQEAI